LNWYASEQNGDASKQYGRRFAIVSATSFLTDHERLEVWQRGMDLLVECYRLARMLPVEERYGLASQIRRAAVSVPANIAEGCGRTSPGDRLQFMSIARGSLCELRTLLSAMERLSFADARALSKARDLSQHTARLLSGLQRYIRNSRRSSH
jgi:four helix bundle protein